MSIEMQFFVAGIGVMLLLNSAIFFSKILYRHFKAELEHVHHPKLVEYSEYLVCRDPHVWQQVALAVRELPFGQYRACAKCGAIAGEDRYMLSAEVLEQIREATALEDQRLKAQQAIDDRIMDLTYAYVEQYIRIHFPEEVNDEEFVKKLDGLVKCVFESMLAANEKVLSELEGQKDLDDKYSGWADKMKGNA